jgi:hypothetical protein
MSAGDGTAAFAISASLSPSESARFGLFRDPDEDA